MTAGTDQPQQSDQDQIDSDDVIQQARNYENQNAGDQCHHRPDAQVQIHVTPSIVAYRCSKLFGHSAVPLATAASLAVGASGLDSARCPVYLAAFFACLASRFSFMVFAGFFLFSFLRSIPLLIAVTPDNYDVGVIEVFGPESKPLICL